MNAKGLTYLAGEDGGLPADFSERFWGGARLEPRCRSDKAVQAGLEACIADPLWMLARQWQMGEFKGEDNGSPVRVEIEYETELLNRVAALPAGAPQDFSSTTVQTPIPFEATKGETTSPPLETVVEREPIAMDWRTRVQIGQQFERFLRRALGDDQSEIANQIICAYRQPAPFFGIELPENLVDIDYATQRFLRLMQGRAIDGGEVLRANTEGLMPTLPVGVDVPEGTLDKALEDLVTWYNAVYSRPAAGESGFWKPQELEYEFALAGSDRLQGEEFSGTQSGAVPESDTQERTGFGAPQDGRPSESVGSVPGTQEEVGFGAPQVGRPSESVGSVPPGNPVRTELIAPDYRNGDLDWYSCDIGTQGQGSRSSTVRKLTLNPMRVGFAGKPNERWWAFEDANVDLAKLDAVTPNLGRLLMLEFALIYADDWYLVPLELPLGSVTRIRSLKVHDVFGVGEPECIDSAIEVGKSERDGWQLFTLTDAKQPRSINPRPGLFLPPTPGAREESSPIEEVRFVRDEGANMVFAIEKTLQNGLGTPVDGSDAQLERRDRERKKALEDCEWELVAVEARLAESGLTDAHRQSLEADAESLRGTVTRLRGGTEPSSATSELPVYRLASAVPDNWIPYVPKKVPPSLRRCYGASEHSVRLRQAEMVRSDDASCRAENSPLTRILADDRMRWLNEESVPRAGVKVQLTRQRVRWTDGKTYVWIGRKVVTGRGEAASGLAYDTLGSTGGRDVR